MDEVEKIKGGKVLERRGSTGMIEEAKRKRDEFEESEGRLRKWRGREGEEEWVFKRSAIIARSPEGEKREDKEEWKDFFKELSMGLREEIALGLSEIKREIREELKENSKGQEELKKELREVKRELEERERRWEVEKKEMKEKIKEVEKRIEEVMLKNKASGVIEDNRGKGEGERRGEEMQKMEGKMSELEWRMEKKEREGRRRNIVIKGIREGTGEIKEGVEKLLKEIGVEGRIEEVRRLRVRGMERTGMAVVACGSMEMKKEVMEKKRGLKGRKERIEDDLTWRERKMMWRLWEMARKEEREGRRVWVKYGRIWMDGKWWRWDERSEELRGEGGGYEEGERENKNRERMRNKEMEVETEEGSKKDG